jgi:2-oxoglutarate ferredoxin oxidoreductase subunit alpha
VSGFQIHFSSHDIMTPGDAPGRASSRMNPAALKTNLSALKVGGLLIINTDAFNEQNLEKRGLHDEPSRRRGAR